MARALRLASTTFEDIETEPSVYIQGTSLLLEDLGGDDPETTLTTLRTLLRMIEEKSRLVQLLDAYMDGDGLTVVIGSEHQEPDLQHFSVVTSTYSDGTATGAVGVIGPTRMRYSRAINVVDSLSQSHQRGWSTQNHDPWTIDIHDIDEPAVETGSDRTGRRRAIPAELQQRARRVLRSPAAQDGRVRQLPQADRPRAPGRRRKRPRRT